MRRKFSGTQTVVDGSRVFVKSFLSTTTQSTYNSSSCPQWNKSIQFTSLKHDAFVTNQRIIESIPKTVREELPGWCNAQQSFGHGRYQFCRKLARGRALILIRLESYPVWKPKENDFIRFVIWSAGTQGEDNIISKLSGWLLDLRLTSNFRTYFDHDILHYLYFQNIRHDDIFKKISARAVLIFLNSNFWLDAAFSYSTRTNWRHSSRVSRVNQEGEKGGDNINT